MRWGESVLPNPPQQWLGARDESWTHCACCESKAAVCYVCAPRSSLLLSRTRVVNVTCTCHIGARGGGGRLGGGALLNPPQSRELRRKSWEEESFDSSRFPLHAAPWPSAALRPRKDMRILLLRGGQRRSMVVEQPPPCTQNNAACFLTIYSREACRYCYNLFGCRAPFVECGEVADLPKARGHWRGWLFGERAREGRRG
jgi:hypothetical protein